MLVSIFLAILVGILVSVGRSINGRLGIASNALNASFWNHFVGFLFLSLLLLVFNEGVTINPSIPIYAYIGGFLGVLFVAVNTYALPRIGTMNTIILVISGQMISSVLMDFQPGELKKLLTKLLGVSIIILGIYLTKVSKNRH